MKKKINFIIMLVSLGLAIFWVFWIRCIPFYKDIASFLIGSLLCFFIVLSFYFNNDFFSADISEKKEIDSEEEEFLLPSFFDDPLSPLKEKYIKIAEELGNKKYQQEQFLNEMLYPLQMIQAVSRILKDPISLDKQISAGEIIEENIYQIKRIFGNEFFTSTELIDEHKDLPLALQKASLDITITQKISIGIFGRNNNEVMKLKMLLQAYGFFCRNFFDTQIAITAIEEDLVHFLIILPESAEDDSFTLCKKIREKYSALEFPILTMVSKFNSYLIEKAAQYQTNDFIIIPFDNSELITRIQVLVDLTNTYIKNQELFKSEKEKRAFLYFVTHNVNTPLTILLNEIHELAVMEEMGATDELKPVINNIQQSANEIDVIIQNVLTSYKISDGRYMLNPKMLNLPEFIEIENIYLKNKTKVKQQSFSYSCPYENLRVFCDENSLKGIYTNLVDNAIKYAPVGGKISVEIVVKESEVCLSVKDNGSGIPKEKQLVIFNRFAGIGSKPTGGEKSVGLGLYVVGEICKLNNLDISYSDNTEEESGSCFTIKFPKIGE